MPGPKQPRRRALRLKDDRSIPSPTTTPCSSPIAMAVHILHSASNTCLRCYPTQQERRRGERRRRSQRSGSFRKYYAWTVLATGPNHGIQLGTGRLIVVWLSTSAGGVAPAECDHHDLQRRPGQDVEGGRNRGAPAPTNGSTQMRPSPSNSPTGRVMLNVRSESRAPRRLTASPSSPDGRYALEHAHFDDALLRPICMGGIVRHTTTGTRI